MRAGNFKSHPAGNHLEAFALARASIRVAIAAALDNIQAAMRSTPITRNSIKLTIETITQRSAVHSVTQSAQKIYPAPQYHFVAVFTGGAVITRIRLRQTQSWQT